jgi:hypothetical protein
MAGSPVAAVNGNVAVTPADEGGEGGESGEGGEEDPIVQGADPAANAVQVGNGYVVDTAHYFNDNERSVADYLAANTGAYVESLATARDGRFPDALVGYSWEDFAAGNVAVYEFKTLTTSRADPSTTITRAVGSSLARGGQAPNIVIDGRGVDLSEAEAQRAIARVQGYLTASQHSLDSLQIIGRDYYLYYLPND